MKILSLAALVIIGSFFVVDFAQAKERNNKPYRVVCYYESWTDYDEGDAHFAAEDVDANVCTHINYAFASLKNNQIALFDPELDANHKMIQRMVALRKRNPHLTTMISLGGWADGSNKYSEMVRSESHRQTLIKSIVKFLQHYDLDGIDIDWEYPGFTGVGSGGRELGRAQDKQDFITFLHELKQTLEPHGYLLTAAISAGKYQLDHGYDIAGLSKYLDFINVMTYDYHDPSNGKTGHNAPLSAQSDSVQDKQDNIHYAVDYLIQHGADPKKLILGIPLYGKSFALTNADQHGVGAKSNGAGKHGGNFNKICLTLKQPGWIVHWDERAQVPYAVNGKEWISYDDQKSVQKKLEFIREKKLGGSMVWSIDGDDFRGHCGNGKYPLMKLQMKMLNNVIVADQA